LLLRHPLGDGLFFFMIRLGCRRRGKLQSFFADAIAPETFLREVLLTVYREQLCLAWPDRCGFIWCEFLAVRATPFRASCGLAPSFLAEAPHPGSSSSWPNREGSQVAAGQLRSNNRSNLDSLRPPFCCRWSPATMPSTWAEGRASAEKQPERRPRGQHRMGRHDAALFHSGLAPKR
jgi:hypothetical protein